MLDRAVTHSKILIIDDESTHIDFLRHLLAAHNYRRANIQGVTNPRDALSGFNEFQPDLVILDLLMPGVGGMQVLKQLRASIPSQTFLPVLVVTSDLTIESRREALACGATDFVVKPYESAEILLRIENLLYTRVLHCELARIQAGSKGA
jgi:DNA-binding response OmpR family regulator